MTDPVSLHDQLDQLRHILAAARSTAFWRHVPILDDSSEGDVLDVHENDLSGLKHFKQSIQKEIEVIESHLAFEAENGPSKTPSTNSLYYFALWKEILLAPRPIQALGKTFPVPVTENASDGKPKKENATKQKVDIVGDDGRVWMRVNTTKESRLLAEFRNIEAFYEDSDDESIPTGKEDSNSRRLPPDAYLDNSVYETGKLLDLAAQQHSLEYGFKPTIHLRLTRLDDPSSAPSCDKRVLHTITSLQSLGVVLTFGSPEANAEIDSVEGERPQLGIPPTGVNLDLSMLIALVTDITHFPLPTTDEEADERFRPQAERSWKRQIEKNPDISEDAIEHCRALAIQTQHEMRNGLIKSLLHRLKDHVGRPTFRFWTTEEARDRFFTILDKIGGEFERARARALFSEDANASDIFWQDSRITPEERINLLPIKIFPDQDGVKSSDEDKYCEPFYDQMIIICRSVLSRPTRPEPAQNDGYTKLPAPTRYAARLSAHTVQSLLYGSLNGMVTLTSNKSSVRSLLREMRGFALPSAKSNRGTGGSSQLNTKAAIWVLEPRSLAEGMRAGSED